MFLFVLSILFALVAAGLLIVGKIKNWDGDGDLNLRKFAVIPVVLGVLCLTFSSLRIIKPGTVGIPVSATGSVSNPVGPGTHFVVPWTTMSKMNIRTQTYTMDHTATEGAKKGDDSIAATTRDGASVSIDGTIVYHLDKNAASDVYKKLGTDYTELLRSTSRTAIRGAFGGFDAIPAATTDRKAVSDTIQNELVKTLGDRGIVVEQFQLRNVGLPKELQDAISLKLAAQQAAQQQQFELEKAKKQAEVRVADAEGLAKAQQIIQSTLTPEYLQHEYIDALKQTINSPNNTTVILPFDQNLTPMLNIPGTTRPTAK